MNSYITFLEDEQTRQGNILNNKTKEIGQSLMLLIKDSQFSYP
jgi:hypothetical protein